MRMLLIGDIVGKPGRLIVQHAVAGLRQREQLDLIVANAENATGGSGLSVDHYQAIVSAGVDAVTLGDHIYRRKQICSVLSERTNIVKPANFPPQATGKEWVVVTAADGTQVAVVSLLGRVFMRPVDCPFAAIDRVLEEIPAEVTVRLVDMHAEATSDMQLMGRYLDGRVSAVLGTHTHVATADEQIFPGGTAFQCDVGMTGPHESILGRRIDRVTFATTTFEPAPFDVATGDVRLCGTIVEVDPATGHATDVRRLVVREEELAELRASTGAAAE